MPEYSSTTITPADSVKVPAMNGGTSGNFQLDALRNFILASKGQANGLASLGADGKLTAAQLPDLADDVLVYGSYALLPNPGIAGKLYITADDNKMYRWDDALATPAYVVLSVDLSAYATKAEVEAADTDLKNALQATNARVENLEQKAGGYTVVNYRGTNAVPSGKAKYAMVETLVGKSRGWNQLIKNGDFAQGTTDWTTYGYRSSISASDGVLTQTFNTTDGQAFEYGLYQYDVVKNTSHEHLISFYVEPSFATKIKIELGGSALYTSDTISANTKTLIVYKGNPASYNNHLLLYPASVPSSVGETCKYRLIFVRDLTLIFGSGNEPSTVAEAVALCPSILTYDAYGYSLVDTVVEGVRSAGRNLVDIPTTTWASDGSKDFSINLPIGTYTLSMTSSQARAWLCFLRDSDGDITQASSSSSASGRQSVTFTLSRKATTLTVYVNGATEMSDIQLEEGSTATAYSAYHAPSTLSLPTPVTLRSAGSVHEELDVESGKKTRPIGSVVVSSSNLSDPTDNGSRAIFNVTLEKNIKYVATTDVPNVVMAGFVAVSQDTTWANGMVSASTTSLNKIYFILASGTTKADCLAKYNGAVIFYELATPDTDEQVCDPIIDNTIQTEGGGTINTIQTQTPKIDNCIDVGYLAV